MQWCAETPSVKGRVLTNWPTIVTKFLQKKVAENTIANPLGSLANFWPTFLQIWSYGGGVRHLPRPIGRSLRVCVGVKWQLLFAWTSIYFNFSEIEAEIFLLFSLLLHEQTG